MQTATSVPALVAPETRRSAYLPKWTLRAVLLLGVIVTLGSRATASPVVFEVSGGNPSEDGAAVSGTVTIDTATGKVLSADVTATCALYLTELVFDHVESVHETVVYGRRPEAFTTIVIGTGIAGWGLALTVQESTLVGYKGSPLYSLPVDDLESCIAFPTGFAITLYGSLDQTE